MYRESPLYFYSCYQQFMCGFTGIKCYYDGEDVTHLVKLSPSSSGDKLAQELSQILPLVVKDKQEFTPASEIKQDAG